MSLLYPDVLAKENLQGIGITIANDIKDILDSGVIDVNLGITEVNTNINQVLGGPISVNDGIADNGCLRVCPVSVNGLFCDIGLVNGFPTATGNGVANSGTLRTVIANNNDPIDVNVDSQTSNIATNLVQVNGAGIDNVGASLQVSLGNIDGNPVDLNIGDPGAGTLRVVEAQRSRTLLNKLLRNGINPNMTGNYTLTPPQDFIYTSTADSTYILRMILLIEDNNNTIQMERYGGIPGGLTNGIRIFINSGGKTYIEDTPILTNSDWANLCYDTDIEIIGAGNDTFTIRWSFNRGNINGLRLDNGDSFGLELSDNFTGLIKHRCYIQGYTP